VTSSWFFIPQLLIGLLGGYVVTRVNTVTKSTKTTSQTSRPHTRITPAQLTQE